VCHEQEQKAQDIASKNMSHQEGSSASDEFDDSDESLQSSDLDKEYEDFMAEQEAFDSVDASIVAKLKE